MKLNRLRNTLLVAALMLAAGVTSAQVIMRGETSPGVYTNVAVDSSGVVSVTSSGTSTTTVTGTVAATQSGTWTVQPGNTANTTAWKVDNSAVTQPVKAAVSTLTDRSGTITSGGVAQTAMSSNSTRQYLLIQNSSDTDMWFNFTTTAVADQPSVKLIPGASFVMEGTFVSTEAISVIGATTGKSFTMKEK